MSNESKLRVRRTFTLEFKREAVELIRQQGLSVAEAARRLDVRETLLRRWRKELGATKTAGGCGRWPADSLGSGSASAAGRSPAVDKGA